MRTSPKLQCRLRPGLLFLFAALATFVSQGQMILAGQMGYDANSDIGLSNYTDPMMGITSYQGVGQTFRSLSSNTIATLQFYMENVNSGGNVTIEIYSCSGPDSWGTLLGTKTGVPLASGWVSVDLSSLNIAVTVGNYYGFKLLPESGLQAGIGVNDNLYADGQSSILQSNGNASFFGGWDFPFNVTGSTVLPITLAYFDAQLQNKAVLLKWATMMEENSKDFGVQQSTDGSHWNTIADLPASRNSNSMLNYQYVSPDPSVGNNQYRLLLTDMDGKASYSEVRTVFFAGSEPAFNVVINPVTNGVLKVQVSSAITLRLYSADGRLLWKKPLAAGMRSLDIGTYGKGIFFLRGDYNVEKILVQ